MGKLDSRMVGVILAAGKGAGVVGPSASPAVSAKALATGGTIWSGKGLSLGLGIGLGAWGPVLLLAGGAAAVYGYLQYRKRHQAAFADAEGDELHDALANDERFGIWGGLSERERRRLKRAQSL